MRGSRAVAAAIGLVGLVWAPGAAAATVQIGSSLNPPPATVGASPGSYTLITTKTQVSQSTASPVDGTVVSWQTVGWTGSNFHVRVVRPLGGLDFRGIGTGPAFNIGSTAATGPIAVNLAISKGEMVAVDANGDFHYSVRAGGGASAYAGPPLPDGGTGTAAPNGTNEYVYQATVRYCLAPSVVGMKLGRARKALAAADCAVGSVTPPKKQRKGKYVRSQGVPAGSSVSDTAPIGLRVGRQPKKRAAG